VSLYICPTCGKFNLTYWTSDRFLALEDRERLGIYKVSFELRRISENALDRRDAHFFPVHSTEALEKWCEQPDFTVQEKLYLLLTFLGRTTLFPGQEQLIDLTYDYPIVCARNSKEYEFYCESLEDQLLLTRRRKADPSVVVFELAASGWRELETLKKSGSDSPNAFIAMSFDPSRDVFSAAISSAIKSAGYTPVRIDRIEHVNRIDDEIIAQIRGSKFLVSDFTGQRNGVYFEAGLMLGLGRPVIWLCEQEDLKNVHFDTRQYNTIDYKDAFDLQKRLQFRIEAILGKGPHKPD
jgi:hypothetical protein